MLELMECLATIVRLVYARQNPATSHVATVATDMACFYIYILDLDGDLRQHCQGCHPKVERFINYGGNVL